MAADLPAPSSGGRWLLLLSVPRPVQLQQTVGGRDSALAVVTMPGTWSGT
jgi:hypothetical protein